MASKSRNRPGARTAPAATAKAAAKADEKAASYYPGQQFGLPERGSGSVSGMIRRFAALLIDHYLPTLRGA